MKLVARILITALAIGLSALILGSHMDVVSDGTTLGTFIALVVVAVVYGLVHMIVKPIVQLISFPLYILTLGLVSLLVNTLMLWITTLITNQSWFSDQPNWGLEVNGGFWWYLLGALVISVVQTILLAVLPKQITE
ncbi:phage holin family protein [Promicromonospora citrea]|uniref:Membrane protein n=1 Tax=Promicromonospora citrea TaxID=43677 RepID=A0A8H9GKX0_9MICO|nr:phage holin family protein [Promicromonospora citrea]NNH50806.1 phage holin family protein [Promicromonospora citrea]GGM35838.1 membrane protein [Promicromonospora citrea]